MCLTCDMHSSSQSTLDQISERISQLFADLSNQNTSFSNRLSLIGQSVTDLSQSLRTSIGSVSAIGQQQSADLSARLQQLSTAVSSLPNARELVDGLSAVTAKRCRVCFRRRRVESVPGHAQLLLRVERRSGLDGAVQGRHGQPAGGGCQYQWLVECQR